MNNDPLRPHRHDPNPMPPSSDPDFRLTWPPLGHEQQITPSYLATLPPTTLTDCYIVSTGHGTSGPFTFCGPTLWALLEATLPLDLTWQQVEVISADGFGTRLTRAEVMAHSRPIILALTIDEQAMTRAQGLVRLIVPSEYDDALRQVKWIGQIHVICKSIEELN